jgi:2-polyprenyl-3-methyl-5-hydroxy-6-metoxy-1,4-benzoquinol methylase
MAMVAGMKDGVRFIRLLHNARAAFDLKKQPMALHYRADREKSIPVNAPNSVHARLLARIHRRYRTVTESIALADRSYSFTRIADPNRVLDEVAADEQRLQKLNGAKKEDYLHLPYWAELWDSALGMGQLVLSIMGGRAMGVSPKDMGGTPMIRRVLDLGCGMGFAGMVAASVGCRVVFADIEPPALLFAQLNSLRYSPTARTRQLNWQTTRLDEQFDLILGADILYERKQWDYLEPFWREHLAVGGSVLLGEPGRQTGDNFPAWITPRGWTIAYHEQKVVTRNRPIRLFELRRV